MGMERKTDCKLPTFLGVTNGEWIGMAAIMIGLIYNYAVMGADVANNSELTKKHEAELDLVREELTDKIQESEQRTGEQIKESERRTRGDIRELRQIMLQGTNGH
jgi:hypothetical protein